MPRRIERGLSPRRVQTIEDVGMHADGLGLYLQVKPALHGGFNRSWIFRYRFGGKLRDMGLGSIEVMPLAAARERARELRLAVYDGRDPIAERKAKRAELAKPKLIIPTFDQASANFIADREHNWKGSTSTIQWTNSLKRYASPVIGKLPVSEITTAHITNILNQLWKEKQVSASRLRQRIEQILDWCAIQDHRSGENPARWKGHLEHVYTAPKKKQKHHAALHYNEVGAFMVRLRERDGSLARCIEFVVLTAVRLSEARLAEWSEIDWENKLWRIPAERMKMDWPHSVPLAPRALSILKEMHEQREGDLIFAGSKRGRPISYGPFWHLMQEIGAGSTIHGARSSFRDWAAEQTNYAREVAECCLAHGAADNQTEAAYLRTSFLDKRRQLMGQWDKFVSTPAPTSAKVLSMKTRGDRAHGG